MSLTKIQKHKLDSSFNKAAVSTMTEKEFVKTYAGKLPLLIDINEAMKYLNVKPDKSKSYTSTSTNKESSENK